MLRKYFLILTTGLLLAFTGKAQLADKATFHGGFTYQFVTLTPQGTTDKTRWPFYGLSLGMNYVLAHSNDQASLGINPNGNFSFIFSSFSGTSLLLQGPVFLTARLGSGATPYNEQKVGIGAGIGGNFTYMLNTNGNGGRLRQSWVNPSAMAELALRTRFSNYLFRVNWSLMSPTIEVADLNDLPVQFGNWGISILYNF